MDPVNPNATPGAGRGTPLQREDHAESMRDFMQRMGAYQEARNLASSNKFSTAQSPPPRTTSFPPAVLPPPPRKTDPRKILPDGGKPFAFALSRGQNGAKIWWGMLAAKVTQINATRVDGLITSITQPAITTTDFHVVSNLDTDTTKPTELDWFGNVYLYWEADSTGAISLVEVRGPDTPDGEDISEMTADFQRVTTDGKYYVLIGTVPEDTAEPIDQQISSDVPWFVTIVNGTDTYTGGSGGSEGSTGGSYGSDKSTAIVPASFYSTGYAALFTLEAPDVRFEDVIQIKPRRRKFNLKLDPRFVEVCEKDSLVVVSACPSGPAYVGAWIEKNAIRIHITARKLPDMIALKVSGIRRGFAGMRFPSRTEAQFIANEKFLNSAYPRK